MMKRVRYFWNVARLPIQFIVTNTYMNQWKKSLKTCEEEVLKTCISKGCLPIGTLGSVRAEDNMVEYRFMIKAIFVGRKKARRNKKRLMGTKTIKVSKGTYKKKLMVTDEVTNKPKLITKKYPIEVEYVDLDGVQA